MWKKIVNYVAETSGENQHDLVWSLQPILQSIRVFGIELNVSVKRSNFRRYALTVWAVIIFISMESSLYNELTNNDQNLFASDNHSIKCGSTRAWLDLLMMYEWVLWGIFFPLIIFWTYAMKWKALWKKATKLQELMNYEISFHQQLRLYTLTITVVSITAVS